MKRLTCAPLSELRLYARADLKIRNSTIAATISYPSAHAHINEVAPSIELNTSILALAT